MPVRLAGNPKSLGGGIVGTEYPEYKKGYPKGMDLRPNFNEHSKLLSRIMDKAQVSFERSKRDRHRQWEDIDKVLKAYVNPEAPKTQRNGGEYDKIVLPLSYINLETIMTYMVSAFFNDPIWRYTGTGPEDSTSAAMLTEVVNVHIKRFTSALKLYSAIRDMFAYGIGISAPIWTKQYGHEISIGSNGKKISERKVVFQGNDLQAISPYRYVGDPNVTAHDVENMEFGGWVSRTNYYKLREMENDGDSNLFNVKFLSHIDGRSVNFSSTDNHYIDNSLVDSGVVDVLWLYIRLIPKDWELGKGEDPEIWLFGIAADSVIIKAQKLELLHGRLPWAVGAPASDGYTWNPTSTLALMHDMQEHVNFLFSSHVENIKRMINDMIVVDPMLINIWDLQDPKPGKIIRTRKSRWGTGGIDAAIKQLDVRDVTSGHMADVGFLQNMSQDVTGAKDVISGVINNRGPRISAAATLNARQSALSKLEKDATLIALQFMNPLGQMIAAHTQQFMEDEMIVTATGEMRNSISRVFKGADVGSDVIISPEFLLGGPFDVMTHSGTVPGSEDPNTWVQLLQLASGAPEVFQGLDMNRIFLHIARQLGAKNIDNFRIEAQPDDVVQNQVQQGNLVPALGGDGFGG